MVGASLVRQRYLRLMERRQELKVPIAGVFGLLVGIRVPWHLGPLEVHKAALAGQRHGGLGAPSVTSIVSISPRLTSRMQIAFAAASSRFVNSGATVGHLRTCFSAAAEGRSR